jgi:hypothetical protein
MLVQVQSGSPKIGDKMKKCTKCHEEKCVTEFAFKNKLTGKLQSVCKQCHRKLMQEHYNSHKQYYLDKARRNEINTIIENRKNIMEYLYTHPCVDCGETDPLVLEFDHIKDKYRTISIMVLRKYPWNKIYNEIQKCEVRCANCHRRKTSIDFNHYKQAMIR